MGRLRNWLNDNAQGETTQESGQVMPSNNGMAEEIVELVKEAIKQKEEREKRKTGDFDEEKNLGDISKLKTPYSAPAAPISKIGAFRGTDKPDGLNEGNARKDHNEPEGAGFTYD